MWTMEELMELKTPFLTMQDITKKDWEHLDFEFVLQQIHYNKMNFNEVPNFIRNGRQFQELVVKYNPELSHILFPDRIKMD